MLSKVLAAAVVFALQMVQTAEALSFGEALLRLNQLLAIAKLPIEKNAMRSMIVG